MPSSKTNTLELLTDWFDDPGDYPSGAGGGPLPSHDYVAEVGGAVVVEFAAAELQLEPDESPLAAIQEFIADNPAAIEHGVSGLKVTAWDVDGIDGMTATLSVRDFEAELPEPDYDESDYDEPDVREDQP